MTQEMQGTLAAPPAPTDRRRFVGSGLALAVAAATAGAARPAAASDKYADPEKPMLPPSDMTLDLARTALVVIDPQVDFLSPKGVAWGAVGDSVRQHDVVENIERLFKAARGHGLTVAVSPHYYFPTDKGWKFEGALEKLMHNIGMFNRRSQYTMDGFEGSGADFMPQYKPFILTAER
jgi:hypothetical protein